MEIELKIGRNIFYIDEKDMIMDNNACFQLITKLTGRGYNRYSPTVSKALITKLKKRGYYLYLYSI